MKQQQHGPGWQQIMSGRMIEPVELRKGMKVTDLVEVFARMGFNARRLAEGCELFGRMIDAGATVGLTVTGAMSP